MRVLNRIEDVEHGNVACRQHHPPLVDGGCELVEIRLHLLFAPTQAPGLAQESPGTEHGRIRAGYFGQFSVGEPAQAVQPGKRDALDDFGIEVEFGAPPQPRAEIQRRSP